MSYLLIFLVLKDCGLHFSPQGLHCCITGIFVSYKTGTHSVHLYETGSSYVQFQIKSSAMIYAKSAF